MYASLARIKARLEKILSASTGNVVFTLTWATPQGDALAQAGTSSFYSATASVAKDKLINQAEADNEPAAEVNLYNALPSPNISFFYSGATSVNAGSVLIPSSLNKHLAFGPHTTPIDGTITVRPPSVPPDTTTRWQFYKGVHMPGHVLFEAVIFHECLHGLGFISVADLATQPGALDIMDLFRFSETNVPTSTGQFQLTARELRPTVEAVLLTKLGTTYPAARGRRTGGDGEQASHWRAAARLTPPAPVGVMDPNASPNVIFSGLQNRYFTRADVEVLDIIGWNINPNGIQFSNASPVDLIAPGASSAQPQGQPIVFTWQGDGVNDWSLFIFPGAEPLDDSPARVIEGLTTTEATLSAVDALPPGQYSWYVVGDYDAGIVQSETRLFSVVASCPADFNTDGDLNPDDLADYLNCYFAIPPCAGADFNLDGDVNPDDLADYLNAYFAGC